MDKSINVVSLLGPSLCANREVMTRAVEAWGGALKYASLELRCCSYLNRIARAQASRDWRRAQQSTTKDDPSSVSKMLFSAKPKSKWKFKKKLVYDPVYHGWKIIEGPNHLHRKLSSGGPLHQGPTRQQRQHERLQVLATSPLEELSKDQQHEVKVLQKKLRLKTAPAVAQRTTRQELPAVQALQSIIGQSSCNIRCKRTCSDHRRLQYLQSLPRPVRRRLTSSPAGVPNAFHLQQAERKAQALVGQNRKNSISHTKGKWRQHSFAAGFSTKDFLTYELGLDVYGV